MIRYKEKPSERWEDCLKSVNEARQMEECRCRLLEYEGRGLFSDLGPLEGAELRRRAYDAQEGKAPSSTQELRERVLRRAEEEAMYLGRAEDEIVRQMAANGWSVIADDWEQLPALESLIRRSWCTISFNDDDSTAVMTVEPPLREAIFRGLNNQKTPAVRETLFRFSAMLHSIRYLYGFVYPCPLMEQFRAELKKKQLDLPNKLTERFIKAEFDYMITDDGQLFLPHPALADPGRILSEKNLRDAGTAEITFENMLGGMGGILPEEVPSVTCFKGMIAGAIRPESNLNQTVDDLRYMAKQGAGLNEMVRILRGRCSMLPSQRMIDALERMRQEAVLWTGSLSAVQN